MHSAGLMVETTAESMGRQMAEKRAQYLAPRTAEMMACQMVETTAKSLDVSKAVTMGCSMVEKRAHLIYLATHSAGMWASLTQRGSLRAESSALKRLKDSSKDLSLAGTTAVMWANQTLMGAHWAGYLGLH